MGSHSFQLALHVKLLFLHAVLICNISVSLMFSLDNYNLDMNVNDDLNANRDEIIDESFTDDTLSSTNFRQNEYENIKNTVIQGLRLTKIPDVTKMNVSQEEYSRMYGIYLKNLKESQANDSSTDIVPKFYTFTQIERRTKRRQHHNIIHIVFDVSSIDHKTASVEHSTLRLLASPASHDGPVLVQIYQLLGNRKRIRLVDERQVHLAAGAPKWCEFDVTPAVRAWLEQNERNRGLEIHCAECQKHGYQIISDTTTTYQTPVINALVSYDTFNTNLNKRSAEQMLFYEKNRRTDCYNKNRKRCCRHKMQFNMKQLGLDFIIQPKEFDGGICKGRCPPHYNAAHYHAIIQSIMWKKNKELTPRVCCAPSKLRYLEVLTIDEHDPAKLRLKKWENMVVQECACS